MSNLSKIEELCHRALEYSSPEREAFLKQACGDDRELLREIESLLAFDEPAQNFFEKLPEDVAADLFSNDIKENLVGKELNHYRVLSFLGAGGMGEVYLAEDTRLKRKTAIKILPVQFSTDTERKIRFEQEAQAVSALNHPNILTIYGIEQIDHYNFIATELIEGATLREKIAERKLSWQEMVEIAIQVAGALESAHSVGIIHRDIKPANIMIRQDGIVKVLDFGLAKLTMRAADSGDFKTLDQTGQNRVMGTINYMSPEQALGEKVDARTDIFSLGVVLYEMLSGVQPFAGASDAAVYNATINRNPPSLLESNAKIPLALDQIVKHAMEKPRESRYRTVAEFRTDLQKIRENSNLSASNFIAFEKRSSFLKFLIPPAVVGILILAGVYFGFGGLNQPAAPKISNYTQLTNQSGEELFPGLSPDGKTIIYSSRESGNWDIYFQRVGGSTPINLTKDSPADDIQPAYSPNGDEIAFRSERDGGGGIFVMGATGESVRKISDVGFYPNWSPDGKEIVYCVDDFSGPSNRGTVPSELWSINLATGEKRLITGTDAVQPNWSPHGLRIAFWGINSSSQRSIWTVAATGGEPTAVISEAFLDWNPFWSPDGHYLYFASDRSGSMNLWRIAIDEKSGAVLGDAEPVTIPAAYGQFFSFSRDGKAIIYVQSTVASNIWRVAFDPTAETVDKQPVAITNDSTIKTDLDISADNKTLAYDTVGGKQEDIFVIKTDGSNTRQLTNTIEKDRVPQWSPDGRRIAFYSNNSGKYEGWLINADGSNLQMVTKTPADRRVAMPVWSPSGKSLLFNISNYYPMIFDPDTDAARQTPQPLPDDTLPNHSFMADSWSADGKKIVGYSSDLVNGRSDIAVYDFDSQKYRHLTNFGTDPYWLSDSRRIVFYSNEAIYLLDANTKKIKELLSVKPYRIEAIAISKDNLSIYYTVQKKESDIWMAKIQ